MSSIWFCLFISFLLVQNTEEDHPDKFHLLGAITCMTQVAAAINEFKRRKDLGKIGVLWAGLTPALRGLWYSGPKLFQDINVVKYLIVWLNMQGKREFVNIMMSHNVFHFKLWLMHVDICDKQKKCQILFVSGSQKTSFDFYKGLHHQLFITWLFL